MSVGSGSACANSSSASATREPRRRDERVAQRQRARPVRRAVAPRVVHAHDGIAFVEPDASAVRGEHARGGDVLAARRARRAERVRAHERVAPRDEHLPVRLHARGVGRRDVRQPRAVHERGQQRRMEQRRTRIGDLLARRDAQRRERTVAFARATASPSSDAPMRTSASTVAIQVALVARNPTLEIPRFAVPAGRRRRRCDEPHARVARRRRFDDRTRSVRRAAVDDDDLADFRTAAGQRRERRAHPRLLVRAPARSRRSWPPAAHGRATAPCRPPSRPSARARAHPPTLRPRPRERAASRRW